MGDKLRMSTFLTSEPLPYYEPRSFDSRIKRIELLRVKGQCYEAEGEKETSNSVPQHNQKKGGKTLSKQLVRNIATQR